MAKKTSLLAQGADQQLLESFSETISNCGLLSNCINKFANQYFMNVTVLPIILKQFTLPGDIETQPLLKKFIETFLINPEDKVENQEIFEYLDLYFNNAYQTLINCQRFDLLLNIGGFEDQLIVDEYADQICQCNMRLKIINKHLYQRGLKDVLIKNHDWATFLEFDDAEVLAANKQFDLMLKTLKHPNCWQKLVDLGLEDPLIAQITHQNEQHINGKSTIYHNLANWFVKNQQLHSKLRHNSHFDNLLSWIYMEDNVLPLIKLLYLAKSEDIHFDLSISKKLFFYLQLNNKEREQIINELDIEEQKFLYSLVRDFDTSKIKHSLRKRNGFFSRNYWNIIS